MLHITATGTATGITPTLSWDYGAFGITGEGYSRGQTASTTMGEFMTVYLLALAEAVLRGPEGRGRI